jgi:hypothetical protein
VSLFFPPKPSDDGAYKLRVNNLELLLPNTITSSDEPIAARGYFEEIDGRDGIYSVRKPNFSGRSLALTGKILDEDTVKKLRSILSYKRITVERDDLLLPVELRDVSIVERVYGEVWDVSIGFESPKYYWESKVPFVDDEYSPGVIVNFGTAQTFPIFVVVAPEEGIQEVKFEFDGKVVELDMGDDLIPYGETLVIDCENMTAVTQSRSVTGFMNDSFFTNPAFIPADSSIVITSSINNGAPFTPEPLQYDGEDVFYNQQLLYFFPFDAGYSVQYYVRYL